MLASARPEITPVWPPAGIALAALLVLGYRVWPGIFLGAFLASVTGVFDVAAAAGVAAGNTLEGLAGVWLLNRFAHGRKFYEQPADVFKFAVVVGMVSLISPPIGMVSLSLRNVALWTHKVEVLPLFAWWLADTASVIVLTPLLVVWSANPRVRWSRGQAFEFALMMGSLVLVSWAVFGQLAPRSTQGYLLPYLCLPFLVWMAFRFGPRETAIAIVVLAAIAFWGTLHGYGLFARTVPEKAVLAYQGFMAFNSVMTLAVAAVVAQRRQAGEELRKAHDELELRVQQRTGALQTEISERKLAEEALRGSEARLAGIVGSAMDAIISVDADQRIVLFNAAAEKMFRCSAAEALGQSLDRFIPARSRARHREHVRDFGATGVTARSMTALGTVEGLRADGQEFPIEASISQGDVKGQKLFTVILRDITERKWAEEALKKANEELEHRIAERTSELQAAFRYARSLLEASLDPLVTISPQGKVTDVNKATEFVTGLAREKLIGSNFSDYFTDPDKANAGYQKVLAEGQVRDYPLTIRQASGRTTDVLYNATVYRNEAGEAQGVFAAARDVTQLKQVERRRDFTTALLALFAQKASSKEYLDSVLEVIRQWSGCQALGIRIVDEHQEIPYESWAGFDPGFLAVENQLSLECDNCCCIRTILEAFEEQDRALLTAGGSFRCDDAMAFVNHLPPEKKSSYRGNCVKFGFASLAIIPIRYRNKMIGAIHLADPRPGRFPPATVEFIESMAPLIGEAVHRFQAEAELAKYRNQLEDLVKQRTGDLEAANQRLQAEIAQRTSAEAALRQTAQELQRSNRDLEQFAYVASHDLQEPLRAVGGYVKLLQHRFAEKLDAKALQHIAGAADGAARMQRLITDLLAFSRVGSQGGALAPADLNELLNEALSNLRASIMEAGAKISSDPLPTLPVDALQIVLLFQNLIGNAIKFRSGRTPEIHVGAQRQEGGWLLSIRDNGIGIEPQYFERIFQIFQRLHTRKQYPGTGIGLAICKKIVERHGGAIWVESQPGKGTTFYFSIPEISAKMELAL
jgi:PAS domain S-box-containing protein